MTTLILSTRNEHKVRELRGLCPESFRLLTLRDFPAAPSVVEDANSFAGNATKKAVQLAEWLAGQTDLLLGASVPSEDAFVLADDSGLEVDVLQGEPGVHSARFAALDKASGNTTDAENNAKLLRLLQAVPLEKRTARFRCVLALAPVVASASRNQSPVCSLNERELLVELFEGTCEGRIAFAPSGHAGFGYDPLFVPTGFDQTFAELGEETKNQISHRARALARLRQKFREGA